MTSRTAAAQSDSFAFAYAAWLLAMLAALGSVFFGEVMELPPCSLCWYQRVCLFPLTVVIAVGIVLRDDRLVHYSAPLAVVGLAIAVFHNLVYFGVVSEAMSPCTDGVPCNTRQIEWLGFITIPLMSLGAFVAILGALWAHARRRAVRG